METIAQKIMRSATASKSSVILTREVLKFGSRAAVQNALKKLCEEDCLCKIGQGIYAKTCSVPGSGERMLAAPLEGLAADALKKLGIDFDLGAVGRDYRDGRCEQMPGKAVFEVFNRRINRKIQVGLRKVYYENNGRQRW